MASGVDAAVEQLFAALDAADLAVLPDAEVCAQIGQLHRAVNRLEAAISARVAVAHTRGAAVAQGFLTTAAFLRARCHLTPGQARRRLDVDTALADQPAVAAAYAAGEIPQGHAELILATLRELPARVHPEASSVLLQTARHYDATRLRQTARRLRLIFDPDGRLGAQLRRDADRWLEIHPVLDGMATITGLLPMETAAALRTALDALDQPMPEETRTAAQRRADNLGHLLTLCLDADRLPISGGHRPHLNVTVDLTSLQQQPYAPPGDLDFGDALHHETARRLGCDATLTRIVVDRRDRAPHPGAPPDPSALPQNPVGPLARVAGPPLDAELLTACLRALPAQLCAPSLPLDVGRTERLIPPHLRRALNVRDNTCIFDGCDVPASWCHAHHRIHWADGGPTALWNLVLLCPRHHVFAHERGWLIVDTHTGAIRVIPPDTPLPPGSTLPSLPTLSPESAVLPEGTRLLPAAGSAQPASQPCTPR